MDTNLIKLTEEQKKNILEEIKYYFKTERDEDLGIIASDSILDFFMNTLGNHIYNKALDDTKLWFEKRLENIEADYYSLYKN